MKHRVSKILAVIFLATGMTSFAVTSNAQDNKPNAIFLERLQLLLDQYVDDSKTKGSPATKESALATCAAELQAVGFQLSSLLVSPYSPGGEADARSWDPETYDEICTHIDVNGDDILMCIRVLN